MDHLVLGPVDVALQEVAEVRVVVRLSIVPPKKTGDLVLLMVLRVENRVVPGADAGLVVQVLGPNVANRAWNWGCHLRSRVKITDTLKLNCLRWLDPQLANREVERDVLLLSECGGEGKLTQSGEEAADLLSRAIAHLGNGFHVYGHFIFVGAGRGDSQIVLRITHSLELSEGGILLAIVHEGVSVTRSQDLVGFGPAEH